MKKKTNAMSKMTEKTVRKNVMVCIDIAGSHTKRNCIGNVFSSTLIVR